MRFKFAYMALLLSFLIVDNNINASSDASTNDENSTAPNTPKKLTSFDEIYELEDRFIDKFSERKKKSPIPTKETLEKCFKEVTNSPTFALNYKSKVVDGHRFHIPKVALKEAETPKQLDRLQKGKAFSSPNKGNALQGHHIQMRDPDNDVVDVWVITRTKHQERSRDLHIPVKKSEVTRSMFGSVQKRLYKDISKKDSDNESSEEESSVKSPAKKQKVTD